MFDDVEVNGDGTITFQELHNALIHGQPNSKFDIKTTRMLINKYDTNYDGEINFHEFENLFNYLNEEYFKFLLADSDGSQTIESEELGGFLKQRGFKFQSDFCNYIVNTIKIHSNTAVTFDYFCRIMTRIEHLTKLYKDSSYSNKYPLETYLEDEFFNEFW